LPCLSRYRSVIFGWLSGLLPGRRGVGGILLWRVMLRFRALPGCLL
jgi:hypothetical protein